MSFTQADVDSVKAVLLALVRGERMKSATINGKRIEYIEADIPELTKLLSVMEASLSSSTASRTYLMETSSRTTRGGGHRGGLSRASRGGQR